MNFKNDFQQERKVRTNITQHTACQQLMCGSNDPHALRQLCAVPYREMHCHRGDCLPPGVRGSRDGASPFRTAASQQGLGLHLCWKRRGESQPPAPGPVRAIACPGRVCWSTMKTQTKRRIKNGCIRQVTKRPRR
jgi:hypothetical protein